MALIGIAAHTTENIGSKYKEKEREREIRRRGD
jgi:hypothetical protein